MQRRGLKVLVACVAGVVVCALILLTGPQPLEATVPEGNPRVSVHELERSEVPKQYKYDGLGVTPASFIAKISFDRQASSESSFWPVRNAFGSTGAERKRILGRRKRIWIDSRRANAHLDIFENLKNVWHYTRNGFRARKLPSTTNLVVWTTRRRAAQKVYLAQIKMC